MRRNPWYAFVLDWHTPIKQWTYIIVILLNFTVLLSARYGLTSSRQMMGSSNRNDTSITVLAFMAMFGYSAIAIFSLVTRWHLLRRMHETSSNPYLNSNSSMGAGVLIKSMEDEGELSNLWSQKKIKLKRENKMALGGFLVFTAFYIQVSITLSFDYSLVSSIE